VNNDQEWRVHLLNEIKEIRKDVLEIKSEMLTLKIKVAGFSTVIGSAITYLVNKFL
jgi:hypothetical protein